MNDRSRGNKVEGGTEGTQTKGPGRDLVFSREVDERMSLKEGRSRRRVGWVGRRERTSDDPRHPSP